MRVSAMAESRVNSFSLQFTASAEADFRNFGSAIRDSFSIEPRYAASLFSTSLSACSVRKSLFEESAGGNCASLLGDGEVVHCQGRLNNTAPIKIVAATAHVFHSLHQIAFGF